MLIACFAACCSFVAEAAAAPAESAGVCFVLECACDGVLVFFVCKHCLAGLQQMQAYEQGVRGVSVRGGYCVQRAAAVPAVLLAGMVQQQVLHEGCSTLWCICVCYGTVSVFVL